MGALIVLYFIWSIVAGAAYIIWLLEAQDCKKSGDKINPVPVILYATLAGPIAIAILICLAIILGIAFLYEKFQNTSWLSTYKPKKEWGK